MKKTDLSKWIVQDKRYPNFNLVDALTSFFDITTPLRQDVLLRLSKLAENEEHRKELEKLAKANNIFICQFFL